MIKMTTTWKVLIYKYNDMVYRVVVVVKPTKKHCNILCVPFFPGDRHKHDIFVIFLFFSTSSSPAPTFHPDVHNSLSFYIQTHMQIPTRKQPQLSHCKMLQKKTARQQQLLCFYYYIICYLLIILLTLSLSSCST